MSPVLAGLLLGLSSPALEHLCPQIPPWMTEILDLTGPQPETRPNVKSLCHLLTLGDGFEKLAFGVLATKEPTVRRPSVSHSGNISEIGDSNKMKRAWNDCYYS